MTSSLYTYRGMPLNKIIATNESDNASGITKEVPNPLATHFREATTYNFLTTTAVNVRQNLTNVIYSVPGLSSLAGRNYSAYYDVYTPRAQPYPIDLRDAKACFSYITVILIGGGGAGDSVLAGNGSSGACVIYQINLDQMGDHDIEIVVGNNSITATGRAGDTILYIKYNDGTPRDIMAVAAGGQSAAGSKNGISNWSYSGGNTGFAAYKNSWVAQGAVGNDLNNVYTINGYRALLGVVDFITYPYQIKNNIWPIFYENPNCYGGTQGPYAANTTPTPYGGYARVYYML